MEKIKIKLIDGGKIPEFKTHGSVCMDCYARIGNHQFIKIPCGKRCLVNLGFAMQLPEGYEAQVRPRSGATSESQDTGFGTIDWDYRGEVKACVINNTPSDLTIWDGDRICQLAIREVPSFEIDLVDELDSTIRGDGGFGHTGKR